ncbi:MAG TPA: CHAT domain-containing protein [Thermoanaerobaculia bacterium]
MAIVFGEPFPLRRACGLFAAGLLLLVAPRAGLGAGFEDGLEHLKLAWAHVERDEWEPAAREAAAAVSLLRESGKQQSLPEALEVLGTAELMLGQPARAADHFQEGLTACGSCEERSRLRFSLSSAYRDLGRYGEAESLLRELLADAEAVGSTEDQALSFKGLALLAAVQGRRAEALPIFQEALRRNGAAEKPADRAHLLESIGVLLSETGDGAQALEFLRQAEVLLAGEADPSRLLRVRTNMAKAHVELGRYDMALALFEEVETASRQGGDQSELARSLSGSAEILQMRGQLEEARKRFEEALAIERRIGRRGGEAKALIHLAQIDLVRGRYDRAFSRYEEAVAVSRAAPDREVELTSLAASADVYLKLNREDEGFARLHHVGELAREIAKQNRPVQTLVAIMQLLAANRLDEALRQIDQGLELARQTGSCPDEEYMLRLRASLLFLLKRLEGGRRDAEAALALSRELGDRQEEAFLNFLLGFISLFEERYDEARVFLQQSLRFEREIGSSGPRAVTLWALGVAYEKQWNSAAAIAAYREAVEISESAFSEVRADDLLAGLAENANSSYGRWARLLAQKGDAEQAFAVAERGRARAFLRRIGNSPPDLRKAVDPVLLREEESLREKIQALTRKASAEQDRLARTHIAREIDGARRDYETLRIRLQQANPEYASLVHPSPLTAPEVQRLLDGETTLIEYLLLEDESMAWVIERDSVHLVRLWTSEDELARMVEELRQRIATHKPIEVQAFFLYQRLFRELEPHIHHKNVLVVPHGALHALPFAALTPDVGKTWLVERYALSVLPSASVLPFMRAKRNRGGGRMLALGDPDGSLPAAAAEARAVAALYGSQALVGREASAAALRAAARPIDPLHIAAHAVFDPARPLFSRIRLADGDLAVHDIFGLDLRGTHLVVLSGCETGVGPATDVGELESLSRAFLYAGAPAVLATLWRVDDLASRALMEAFYRRLRAGTPAAEALRQAQLEILRSGKEWRHPFFWAAFTLTGDPG